METHRRQILHDAIVQLADGDRSGFSVIMRELWPAILALATRALQERVAAEDVAQEVFLRLCARISELDRRRDAVAWVFGIAGYEILTERRRRYRRRERGMPVEAAHARDPAPSPEATVMEHQLAALLANLAGELSPADRRALGLETPTRDAPALDPATQRKRKQRALDRLRTMWRTRHG
jgi:RNA polymerase sigma-70 factor, ECF subfamily